MVYDRGDIIRVQLNPVAGKELHGDFRPCLVLSPKKYNALGLTMIAPITQGGEYARFHGFSVTLMGCGTQTQGVVVVSDMKSLDLVVRKTKKVEVAPPEIVDEVLEKLSGILGLN